MCRNVLVITWLLYLINPPIKAVYANTQENTSYLINQILSEDVSTLDTVTSNEEYNNSEFSKFKRETNDNYYNVSPEISKVDSVSPKDDNPNSNLRLKELDTKEKSRDVIKPKELENERLQMKLQTQKDTTTNPRENPKTSNEDRTSLNKSKENLNTSNKKLSSSNLDLINSSKDPSNSKLDPTNSREDPSNSNIDPKNSSKDPLNSNLDPTNSSEDLKTSNRDPSVNSGPNLDDSQDPVANQVNPNSRKLQPSYKEKCLTGYMTDVQAWVDENGNLTHSVDFFRKIDVSSTTNPVTALSQKIHSESKTRPVEISYLSLAKCKLKAVPQIFNLQTAHGTRLQAMVEYVTFFGNDFSSVSSAGVYFEERLNATGAIITNGMSSLKYQDSAAWASAFTSVTLTKLKELDLRKCSIQQLSDNLFQNMPKLQALYLGENYITSISVKAFAGIPNLRRLDMSRNLAGMPNEILRFEHEQVFNWLTELVSLDLSFTIIQQRDSAILQQLSRNLQSLSICYSGLGSLPAKVFAETQLRYLDVSGNFGILGNKDVLTGLQMSLEVIYAKDVGLKDLEGFKSLQILRIIDVDSNEIFALTKPTAQSLKSLKALNLDNNRIVTWWEKEVFSSMPKLRFLSLRNNNIHFISDAMIEEFTNIDYIGLSGNSIVCNCYTREVFEIAYRNQNRTSLLAAKKGNKTLYHRGFDDVNQRIKEKKRVERVCPKNESCTSAVIESDGNFTFFDFDPKIYTCLSVPESKPVPFSKPATCMDNKRADYYDSLINSNEARLIFLLIIPVLVFPVLIFLYIFRRNLKYFCITMKNSATLSLINSDKTIDDDTIFHYDVFVSYCNGDRNWVLDHLLPHVEKDCNVSVCLHERDFQVGLSILENIVSCMDRSRCIMLVISKQFLASQWCQFEMHLAQHRLLETRREDLILVLLEDVPRRMRPTTLHYLMLTKTYILWPQKEKEQDYFWKRLTKSLIARSRLVRENVSLA